MEHLQKNGIQISGDIQKQQLINTGYYHGYKGYRFFGTSDNRLPFTSYDEIYATIEYDSNLKSLLYGKIMHIETAIKNIALITIIDEIKSNSINDMCEQVVISYKNTPSTFSREKKKKAQIHNLNLQGNMRNTILHYYKKDNIKITHFYNTLNHTEVPIWALFEILTMGDFGYLLSCLTMNMRQKISLALGLNLSSDTNRTLIYKYIYALKDLRNAIAHNEIIYDTRFGKINPTPAMKSCLKCETGLPYINFKTLGDYIILVCYFLKLLKVAKSEIETFISSFERITISYKSSVPASISSITIHPDLATRMRYIKKLI